MPRTERKTASAEKLLEKLPDAILNGASPRAVAMAEGLSQKNASSLAAAIATPIEQFNERLAEKLGIIADEYLDEIRARRSEMPAASLGYTFAVLVDKRTALTGRTNPAGTSVNVQVNNNGLQMSKEDLMDLLTGKRRPTHPQPIEEGNENVTPHACTSTLSTHAPCRALR